MLEQIWTKNSEMLLLCFQRLVLRKGKFMGKSGNSVTFLNNAGYNCH